ARGHVSPDPAHRVRGSAGEGMSERAFGVTAGLDPEIASPLAGRCQELGYVSIWSNDHPGAKGLETLAAYSKGADRIGLGVAGIAPGPPAARQDAPYHRAPRLARRRPQPGPRARPP